LYLPLVSVATEDHPGADALGSWKQWLRLALALGWLLFVVSIWFVKGTPRPRRPEDEPATWKLAIRLIALCLMVPALRFVGLLLR